MAKNWKIGEAVEAIQSGNKEDIMDIGKRFPLFAVAAATVAANAPVMGILNAIPERVSVRVIETALKDGVVEKDDDEAEVEVKAEVKDGTVKGEAKNVKAETKVEAKPAKKEAKAEAKNDGDDDYETKGAYPLYCLCKERGIEVKSKQPKDVYIKALRDADSNAGSKEEDEAEAEVEAEEISDSYSKMSAQDLYKECKARKIKAEIKKPAKYYADLLRADDEAAEAETEEESDDWDDEPAKPEAKAKPAAKKEEKKPAKAKDDDDDWDI